MQRPTVRYAQNGELNLAFQEVGSGDHDLILVPPWNSNLEHYWDEPSCARFLEGLASFSRLILFDKRGAGLSDPSPGSTTLEELADDVRAVMDAAGSDRATLFGFLWGGPVSILFATTYPDRCGGLVLYGTFATRIKSEDYPWAHAEEEREERLASFIKGWSEGQDLETLAPSVADDPSFRQWWARMRRLAASPGTLTAEVEMMRGADVRDLLPSVKVPSLVMHRSGDRQIEIGNGRYLAEHIPGARFVELLGADHIPFVGDIDPLLGEIEEFVTGTRAAREVDRVLLTVMFTDIVGSTDLASELGDRRWRDLLATHDATVRSQLARHHGREVKTLGDGFLATFDGPARGIRCAQAIRASLRELGIEIRIGIHTGECEVVGEDVAGMAVNVAARVAATGKAGDIVVSGTVVDLVAGSMIDFDDRGMLKLKGLPGEWRLFVVGGSA